MKRLLNILLFIPILVFSQDIDVEGCTNTEAVNYNPTANNDNGNCHYNIISQIGMINQESYSLSLNYNGNLLAFGNPSTVNSMDAGNVVIFNYENNNWSQVGDIIEGQNSGDHFGCDIALNGLGNKIVIGAQDHEGYGQGLRTGCVQVYENNEGNWQIIGNEIIGLDWNDSFGKKVSINHSGNIIAATAIGGDDNGNASGEVRVFLLENSTWSLLGNIIIGENESDLSGSDIELDSLGTTIVVGSDNFPGTWNFEGQVRVFDLIDNNWIQRGESIIGPYDLVNAGHRVSISSEGNTIALSMHGGHDSLSYGFVRIYDWLDSNWIQRGNDIFGENLDDHSGRSLALSGDGDVVIVGAPDNDGNGDYAGHARLFKWINESWIQISPDIDGDTAEDHFGFCSSISKNGSKIAVGANLGEYTKVFEIDDFSDNIGCTDSLAFNYNPLVTIDDGSCIEIITGCLDTLAFNFIYEANTDDGSCEYSGCMNSNAINFDETATIDDEGTCIYSQEYVHGLWNEVDDGAIEFNEAVTSLSSLQQALDTWNTTIDLSAGWNMFGYGCPSSIDVADGLSNHAESIIITKDNNGNVYMPEFGFNGIGDFTPGYGYQIKLTEAIEGFSLCDWYVNDIPEDNILSLQEENASLQAELDSIYGCIDETACNYDETAFLNNGLCEYPNSGYDCEGVCIDEQACNYNLNEICVFAEPGYNCFGNEIIANIGDTVFGGIVFYIDSTGQNGLVAALSDLEEKYQWGCYSDSVEGADGIEIGTGLQNTIDIVNSNCILVDWFNEVINGTYVSTFSEPYEGQTAAGAAYVYENGGYSDWYLPSKDELTEMYFSIGNGSSQGNIGGLGDISGGTNYWSSSEINLFSTAVSAWYMNFNNGLVGTNNKFRSFSVRPIRSF